MHHYTEHAAPLLISVPIVDPISGTQVRIAMSQPAGKDPLIDALRQAVLGIAATHQAFLFTRSGPRDSAHLIEQRRQLSQSLRKNATHLLSTACANEVMAASEIALVTVSSIALIDIFSGGSGGHWVRNIQLGKSLVRLQHATFPEQHYDITVDCIPRWTSSHPSPG